MVLGVLVCTALVFAGVWLSRARDHLVAEIDRRDADLTAAHNRIQEMEKELAAEVSARSLAEASANAATAASTEARHELQKRQEELSAHIRDLEHALQEHRGQLAATLEQRSRLEADLAREAELRKAAEEEVKVAREQLDERAAMLADEGDTGTPSPSAAPAEGTQIAENPAASPTAAAKMQLHDTPSAPVERSAFDTPPKPLDIVAPEYPAAMKLQGETGHVAVAFTIDVKGRVHDVQVRDATNAAFENAAVAAVRKWRFKPALRDGKPVEVRIAQQLKFNSN